MEIVALKKAFKGSLFDGRLFYKIKVSHESREVALARLGIMFTSISRSFVRRHYEVEIGRIKYRSVSVPQLKFSNSVCFLPGACPSADLQTRWDDYDLARYNSGDDNVSNYMFAVLAGLGGKMLPPRPSSVPPR